MSFIDEMRNLRDSIEETKRKTANAVKSVKQETKQLRRGAQKLVRSFSEQQKARGQNLHQDLKRAAKRLESEVEEIRRTNKSQQDQRRREFAQARGAFWGRQKTDAI